MMQARSNGAQVVAHLGHKVLLEQLAVDRQLQQGQPDGIELIHHGHITGGLAHLVHSSVHLDCLHCYLNILHRFLVRGFLDKHHNGRLVIVVDDVHGDLVCEMQPDVLGRSQLVQWLRSITCDDVVCVHEEGVFRVVLARQHFTVGSEIVLHCIAIPLAGDHALAKFCFHGPQKAHLVLVHLTTQSQCLQRKDFLFLQDAANNRWDFFFFVSFGLFPSLGVVPLDRFEHLLKCFQGSFAARVECTLLFRGGIETWRLFTHNGSERVGDHAQYTTALLEDDFLFRRFGGEEGICILSQHHQVLSPPTAFWHLGGLVERDIRDFLGQVIKRGLGVLCTVPFARVDFFPRTNFLCPAGRILAFLCQAGHLARASHQIFHHDNHILLAGQCVHLQLPLAVRHLHHERRIDRRECSCRRGECAQFDLQILEVVATFRAKTSKCLRWHHQSPRGIALAANE